MKLRAPAIPLITIDPFFSVWAKSEQLNHRKLVHWTGAKNDIIGYITVDGDTYTFLGYHNNAKKLTQTEMDITSLSTFYTFENEKIKLYVRFMTPLLPNKLDIMTRPVSYMELKYEKKCKNTSDVSIRISASTSLCLHDEGNAFVDTEEFSSGSVKGIKMGKRDQNILNRSGDNHRIDWGHFCLAAKGEASFSTSTLTKWNPKNISVELEAPIEEGEEKLILFAYDDIASVNYFGNHLKSYWNKDGKTIEKAISEAAEDYNSLRDECDDFSDKMCSDAYLAGGAEYSDIVCLAYRQVMAGHKLVIDDDGEILYISKECFSNGCAATVDVSYPSIPLYLYYNTELIKGMLRPIYKYAASDAWKYDFAPHDVGQYPILTGQVYGLVRETGEIKLDSQMPVEECGNMIIMETNIALADKDASFAKKNIETLKTWCEYLIKYGDDPENQLCTDDFAGHLAHNCNLSLKAIMGIAGMSIITGMLGDKETADNYMNIAKEKAESFAKRAVNPDGVSYRLAFDKPGSYSMKYNMVWDKIWGTGIFLDELMENELKSYEKHMNKYGMPLDERAEYTKSDWLLWCATMLKKPSDFKRFIAPLWKFYNETEDRVPMSDWYDTVSGNHILFVHRTVQGGLFIKMLHESKKISI